MTCLVKFGYSKPVCVAKFSAINQIPPITLMVLLVLLRQCRGIHMYEPRAIGILMEVQIGIRMCFVRLRFVYKKCHLP